jgi:SAM-dependent methyltransferase
MKCRLCETEKLSLYYTQGNNKEYEFFKCKNCGLVNLDIKHGLDQGKYTETYINPFDEGHKQNRSQSNTYDFIKNKIQKKGKYLDIGCGNGKLLLLAQKDGWDVKGLELSDFFAKTIKERHGIDVEVGNFLEFNNSKNEYDLVTLRHVLEHLPDSKLALNKINELLLSGGFAVLEFPNIDGLEFRFKRLFEKIGILNKKYPKDYKPGHCNEFNKKSFKYLAKKTGFELIIWEAYSSKKSLNFFYNEINFGTKARVLIQKI